MFHNLIKVSETIISSQPSQIIMQESGSMEDQWISQTDVGSVKFFWWQKSL